MNWQGPRALTPPHPAILPHPTPPHPPVPLHSTPLHATPLLHSIITSLQLNIITLLHHSTPLHSTPPHSTPRHATPRQATPRHSTPLHSTPLHSTPLHSTPLHSTPLHSTPPLYTPRHAAPLTVLSLNTKVDLPYKVTLPSLIEHPKRRAFLQAMVMVLRKPLSFVVLDSLFRARPFCGSYCCP